MLTGSPGLGKTRHGVAPDGAPQALVWGWRGGDEGPTLRVIVSRSFRERAFRYPEARTRAPHPAAPTRAPRLLSCRLSLTRRLHPMSRFSEPLWTTPHTKKGTVPFFKGLILSTSQHDAPRTATSTQDNGARCAAQRVGGGEPCIDAKTRPSGSRSRARASLAVLRRCSASPLSGYRGYGYSLVWALVFQCDIERTLERPSPWFAKTLARRNVESE